MSLPPWHHPLCIGCGVRHSKDEACPDGTEWHAAMVECRVCGHRHASVWSVKPGDDPYFDQECAACGRMTCKAVEAC